jgi:glyoxylase-like metal-dependent hydrolase (beta-lactamase superfamily II)
MRKALIVRMFAAGVFLAGAWVARTQSQQPPQLELQKLADDLYVIVGDGGNVAVYVTDEGVILVDDKFERDFEPILAHVKSVSEKPVRYVLNTHQHGDHSGGNAKFLAQGTDVISTANARDNMAERDMPGLARVVFTDETRVFLGGKEVRMKHFGRAHTNGDAWIYFPAHRIVHTGDEFLNTNGVGFIDYPSGGSVNEWSATLDAGLRGFDIDRVIPGHGPIATTADVKAFGARMDGLRNRVRNLLRENKTRDEIAQVLQKEYNWNQLMMTNSFDGILGEMRR